DNSHRELDRHVRRAGDDVRRLSRRLQRDAHLQFPLDAPRQVPHRPDHLARLRARAVRALLRLAAEGRPAVPVQGRAAGRLALLGHAVDGRPLPRRRVRRSGVRRSRSHARRHPGANRGRRGAARVARRRVHHAPRVARAGAPAGRL
ncbi:MAG: hypothetical protein AVDCRST_MAG64-2347, partial [uncultured Phycisphaerae bacterium]